MEDLSAFSEGIFLSEFRSTGKNAKEERDAENARVSANLVGVRNLFNWFPMPRDLLLRVFNLMHSETMVAQTARIIYELTMGTGFEIVNKYGRKITLPTWVMQKYEMFMYSGIKYYLMTGIMPFTAGIKHGYLLPGVPDISTGTFITKLNRSTKEPWVGWMNLVASNGSLLSPNRAKPICDQRVACHVWLTPNYSTPFMYDSLVATLLRAAFFQDRLMSNWMAGDWRRNHGDVYYVFDRNKAVQNIGAGGTGSGMHRVPIPSADVAKAAIMANRMGGSSQQAHATADARRIMKEERSFHSKTVTSARAAEADIKESYSIFGEHHIDRMEHSFAHSVPAPPGFTPQVLTQPSPESRLVEYNEYWMRLVQSHFGLPPDAYRSHVNRNSNPAGNSKTSSAVEGLNNSEKIRQTVIMMRKLVDQLFEAFFLQFGKPFIKKGGKGAMHTTRDEDEVEEEFEEGEERPTTIGDEILESMVDEIIKNINSQMKEEDRDMLDEGLEFEEWQARKENKNKGREEWRRQKQEELKSTREQEVGDDEVPFRDLAEYLIYMKKKGILERQPAFSNAREMIQEQLEKDIDEEATLLAQSLYEQTLHYDMADDLMGLNHSVIKDMILESPQFQEKFRALDEAYAPKDRSKSSSEEENIAPFKLQWKSPPLFDPVQMVSLARDGLLDSKTAVEAFLDSHQIGEEQRSKFMTGINYKKYNESKIEDKKPPAPASGGGAKSSSSSSSSSGGGGGSSSSSSSSKASTPAKKKESDSGTKKRSATPAKKPDAKKGKK